MTPRQRLRLSLPLVLIAACGGAEAPEGPTTIELGTGILAFEPLTNEQELDLIQGPQGGYHFVVSMRASGVIAGDPDDLGDPDNPTTVFQAFRATDEVRIDINNANFTQGLEYVPGSDGVFEMISRLVILDITDDAVLAGQRVRLTVVITDIDGRTAADERVVVAVPHPANQ